MANKNQRVSLTLEGIYADQTINISGTRKQVAGILRSLATKVENAKLVDRKIKDVTIKRENDTLKAELCSD